VDDASWSPDGTKIAFSLPMKSQASEIVRIVDLATKQVSTLPGSQGMYSPRWSPDGRFILAVFTGAHGLKMFDIGKQQWRPVLSPGPEILGFPEWSKDSQFIYYLRFNSAQDKGLYRVRARGGEPERVADLKDFSLGGWFNAWMTLDPGDAPLVVRDLGGADIYALTLEQK
jgi:Tol biopolymer transport system component